VITHLEPDILEYEVKWALGSITTNKASGGDRIPAELFQILKDDAVKVLHSIGQQLWKPQQWPQDSQRKAMPKSVYHTIALISHASKVMLKILQARLQHYVSQELPDVEAGFRKGRGTRNQIANILWIIEQARELQKNICFIDYTKAFDCVDHNKLWKILKEMGIATTIPASWEICMQAKKQHFKPDMEQQTGSKLKGVCQGCILSPCLFNLYAEYIMWNATLDEAQAGIKIARRNSNNLRYADDTTFMAESEEKLKRASWWRWKNTVKKLALKLNSQKTKIMASSPITLWQIDGETIEEWHVLFWGAPKSLQMTVTAAMKLKDACSL